MMYRNPPETDFQKPTDEEIDYIGRNSFYAFLALHGEELLPDESFRGLYAEDGRPGLRPSMVARAHLLQTYCKVSDAEAKQRADFDQRWRVALHLKDGDRPFAKSTFQEFRNRLIGHDHERALLVRSLDAARARGYLVGRRLHIALDTTPIKGRGAVKDTYNLLADGIELLGRAVAAALGQEVEAWARDQGLTRYFGSSVKGSAAMDWDDPEARGVFLTGIVADADRLLYEADRVAERVGEGGKAAEIREASALLRRLLEQDVERTPEGCRVKEGVAKDRVISAHDPEIRHGRKSASKRFDGHKGAFAVDTDEPFVLAVDRLPGNAVDKEGALDLVVESEANAHAEVEKTSGDCAYGSGATREAFEKAGRTLIAPVPAPPQSRTIPKQAFQIDLENDRVTCPECQSTTDWKEVRADTPEGPRPVKHFEFSAEACRACRRYPECVSSTKGKGRTVTCHPQERLLQQARAFQKTEEFRDAKKRRQVVEQRIARLVQLGVRQARYFGGRKTLFQLTLAAVVANLVLLMNYGHGTPLHGTTGSLLSPILYLFALLGVAVALHVRHRGDSTRNPGTPTGWAWP